MDEWHERACASMTSQARFACMHGMNVACRHHIHWSQAFAAGPGGDSGVVMLVQPCLWHRAVWWWPLCVRRMADEVTWNWGPCTGLPLRCVTRRCTALGWASAGFACGAVRTNAAVLLCVWQRGVGAEAAGGGAGRHEPSAPLQQRGPPLGLSFFNRCVRVAEAGVGDVQRVVYIQGGGRRAEGNVLARARTNKKQTGTCRSRGEGTDYVHADEKV